ncbi:hypothetical protein SAMN05444411_1234 [Lutibacter oricola]|uniref:Uncharacterized protein n=1 Tax=Lutibacter oricola TaxID=762486 RepID=A0A1H3H1U9_9FLAO|nr:hypothetical protein [Lutibacter oricola]SDY09512.1 hypothetical protein SAMN05444411_1234 [Lutibacter oricola]
MKKSKEKIVIGVIAFSIIFYMIFTHFTNIDELDKYGVISVGKMIEFGYCNGGANCGKYEYYYDNKRYTSTFRSERNYSFDKKEKKEYINRYFEILLSKQNPEISEIYLNKEINNLERIRKIGFD